jgi:WD40-like Beta Propeller Repeat
MIRSVLTVSAMALALGVATVAPASAATAAPAAAKHAITKIAFADSTSGLWLVNADGTGLRRLAATTDAAHPSFSPDGGTLTFASAGQVWLEVPGQSATMLTALQLSAEVGEPSWSPNGQWIMFSQQVGADRDLFKVSPAGGAVTRITWAASLHCSAGEPAWSPDSSTITYVRSAGADTGCAATGIVVQKLGNKPALAIPTTAPEGAFAQSPSFSADGAHLVFVAACDAPNVCGDLTVGYETTLTGQKVHVVSEENTCDGDLCLESIVGSPAGGWVTASEWTEDDSAGAEHVTCWQGGKDGANQAPLLEAPSFCLENLYGMDFAVH